MGFFDKVKKAFGSKKEDVESQNGMNDEITDKPTPNDKIRNFKYLDDLIHSGKKEIGLDSDIVLDSDEKSQYLDGINLEVDDLIIDGNGHIIDAQGKTRIFYCTGKNITIKNIILKNGYTEKNGGAIDNIGELTITESTLTENTARKGGGAIRNDNRLTITWSALTENRARTWGGAVYNDKGDLTITDSTLTGNVAKGNYGRGGAIYKSRGELTIARSTFTGNMAQEYGGAIHNSEGRLTITESALKENTAQRSGGAICHMGELTMTETTFDENTANEYGMDIFNNGKIYIKDSISSEMQIHNGIGKCYHIKSLKNSQKDFAYLNELINSETSEIELENDIVLNFANNEQKTFEKGIEIGRNNLVIDGNGHTIDAQGLARIFNCNGKNITIRNVTLKNGGARIGGAILNSGELAILDSTLTGNSAHDDNDGGAIYNGNGKLTITRSALQENTAGSGGAIYNRDGELTVTESAFTNNASKETDIFSGGGAIYHEKGDFKIFKCEYSHNKSPNSIILNKDSLQIHNTVFKENQSEHIVLNDSDKSNLGIFSGEFKENNVKKSVLCNDGKFCSVEKTAFQNNVSSNASNIINNSELTLTDPKIRDEGKSILNHRYLLIRKSSPELESMIRGNGTVETDETIIPQEEKFDFSYLDKKIHESNTKEIILDHDITFADYEKDFYEGGIELDMDNLIIDGNGKTIDGQDKSRIFIITGKNITLKNIIIKNGRSHKSYDNSLNNNGGAIKINHDLNLTIEDCEFSNNMSEDMGGGIINYGDLTVIQCSFSDNKSNINGGAIFNVGGKITLIESSLTKNMAEDSGGAIYNVNGELTIAESTFNNNAAEGADMHSGGGAIYNLDGFLKMTESALTKNTANTIRGGGAIYNGGGELTITGSVLNNNSTVNFGGAIYNTNGKDRKGLLTMTECTLDNNHTRGSGGAIRNDSWLTITGSALTGNTAKRLGGAIFSDDNLNEYLKGWDKICTDSVLTITESTFNCNTADDGGAIWTKYKLHPNSENCTFKDNKPDDIHEIDN